MGLVASFALAAAVAFCAQEPLEPRCSNAGGIAVEISVDEHATLERIAEQSFLSQRYSAEQGIDDVWRVSAPGVGGDCEDRLMWAARELRALHPRLADSYRFVLLHEDYGEGAGAQRVRRMHLVLVVKTESDAFVIDTQFRRLRRWSEHYASRTAYSPNGGMGFPSPQTQWVRFHG